MAGWRESLAYTDEDLALALRFRWIRRRWFGRGFKVTTKGDVHTREKIRNYDDFRALITPLVDLDDAGHLSPSEKYEARIAMVVCACRLNEQIYQEARQSLTDLGFDPADLP